MTKLDFITGLKQHLAYIQSTVQAQINGDGTMAGLVTIFSLILQFLTKNAAIDIVLTALMLVTIVFNTVVGVYKAKRIDKDFDDKRLKNSIMSKLAGYFLVLVLVAIFMIILFVISQHEGIKFAAAHWLNLPVALTIVFFSAMEIGSAFDNLSKMGVVIPGFVKNLPDKVKDKINKIGDDSNI